MSTKAEAASYSSPDNKGIKTGMGEDLAEGVQAIQALITKGLRRDSSAEGLPFVSYSSPDNKGIKTCVHELSSFSVSKLFKP